MAFYGKDPEPNQTERLRRFVYRTSENAADQSVQAHDVYFYESGHIGFWTNTENGERRLILATPAFMVREEEEG